MRALIAITTTILGLGGATLLLRPRLRLRLRLRRWSSNRPFWCAVRRVASPGETDPDVQWTVGVGRWNDRSLVLKRGRIDPLDDEYDVSVLSPSSVVTSRVRIDRRWRTVVIAEAILSSTLVVRIACRPRHRTRLVRSAQVVQRAAAPRPARTRDLGEQRDTEPT